MVKALLIVDIQNDFINGSLKVIDGLEIIKDINKVKDTQCSYFNSRFSSSKIMFLLHLIIIYLNLQKKNELQRK